MSQIMYNYPAMLAHAADMAGYAGTLQSLGADIASEQAALQAGWQGEAICLERNSIDVALHLAKRLSQ